LGDSAHVTALAQALTGEKDDRVAASFILALGAIGGAEATSILSTFRPVGEATRVALRKSVGRLQPKTGQARWKEGLNLDDVFLEVPEGLERPASLLLIKAGWPSVSTDRVGLLRVGKPMPVSQVLPAPRWCYAARILLSEESNTDEAAQEKLIDAVAADPPWQRWFNSEDAASFPYRFQVEGRNLDRRSLIRLIARCRAKLEPAGGVDSPSSYAAEIVMSLGESPARIYFRPTFYKDSRFSYRKRDVGAAMNPVVAALLARLAPPGLQGAIIDPVCGSGVPLIERRLFDPSGGPLIGIDISSVAIEASRNNVEAAGMAAECRLVRADARDGATWQTCGFVIANLPYGLRVKAPTAELDSLYLGILRRAEEFLTPDGRCVLATAYKLGLERASKAATKLRTLARYRVQTGGLHVHIAVFCRR
jgi:23S rRNA G2445 N2-methylase RlmL